MLGILIGACRAVGEIVRSVLDAKRQQGTIVYATNPSELVNSAARQDPSLIILGRDLALAAGEQTLQRLARSTCPPVIVVLHDAPPPWLNAMSNVVVVAEDDTSLRGAVGYHISHAANREPDTSKSQESSSLHTVRNKLAGLVMSLRALSVDLEDAASDPDRVRGLSREYRPRLFTIVSDLATSVSDLGPTESRANDRG